MSSVVLPPDNDPDGWYRVGMDEIQEQVAVVLDTDPADVSALAAGVKRIMERLSATSGSPLSLFWSDPDPTAVPATYLTGRVPQSAVWRVGAIAVDLSAAGKVTVTMEDADSGELVAASAVSADGQTLTFPGLVLDAGERLAITVTGAAGSAHRVGLSGVQQAVL